MDSIEQYKQPSTYWEDVTEITQIASRKKFQAGQESHIWIAPLDFDLQFYNMLSPDEKVIAAKFRLIRDQHRYIVSHGILRHILGAYVKGDPSFLKIYKTRYGKPYLDEGQLQFNMSHSEGVACYILSQKNKVGIDIEWIKSDFNWLSIAKGYFNPQELRDLETLSSNDQVKAFFNLWTKKEAILKAIGSGLSGLEEMKTRKYDSLLRKYSLVSFNYGENYLGTASIRSKSSCIRFFQLASKF